MRDRGSGSGPGMFDLSTERPGADFAQQNPGAGGGRGHWTRCADRREPCRCAWRQDDAGPRSGERAGLRASAVLRPRRRRCRGARCARGLRLGVWSDLSPGERADVMFHFADFVEANSAASRLPTVAATGSPLAWAAGGLWVSCNTMRNLAWYAANRFPVGRGSRGPGSVFAWART